MQNGHFGKRMSKAVDKKETKPFFLDGDFSKIIMGFVLQHGAFSISIVDYSFLCYFDMDSLIIS